MITLTEAISKYKSYIGVGINPTIEDSDYWNNLKNFYWTPINVAKFKFCSPLPGIFDFQKLNLLFAKSTANHQVRLHCLLWGTQLPSWFCRASQGERWEFWKAYVRAIAASRNFYAIDVINEPFVEDGQSGKARYRQRLVHLLGEDYVFRAFRYCAEIFPETPLYLNELNVRSTLVWNLVEKVIRQLRAEGINANVGIQAHCTLQKSLGFCSALKSRIIQFSPWCKVHVSECAVFCYRYMPPPSSPLIKMKIQQMQGSLYAKIIKVSIENGAELIGFWNPCDSFQDWVFIKPDLLGIFDVFYRLK